MIEMEKLEYCDEMEYGIKAVENAVKFNSLIIFIERRR